MESKTLQEIIDFLCNDLGGDWLLTGGSLIRLEFDASRGTEDVDLVRIRHNDLSDEAGRNKLFKWLIQRGLGPEWVNTAVEPFVREIEGWERELVEIRSGKKGKVFRPNLTLFVYLKLRRGSQTDLADIKTAWSKCSEGFDERKFSKWATSELATKLSLLRSTQGI